MAIPSDEGTVVLNCVDFNSIITVIMLNFELMSSLQWCYTVLTILENSLIAQGTFHFHFIFTFTDNQMAHTWPVISLKNTLYHSCFVEHFFHGGKLYYVSYSHQSEIGCNKHEALLGSQM